MAFGSAKSKQELANELKTFKSVPKSALHTVQCNISKKDHPIFTFLQESSLITTKKEPKSDNHFSNLTRMTYV